MNVSLATLVKPVQIFAVTHRCTAPWKFTDPGLSGPAANAYLEHHRTCRMCATSLGLTSGGSCTPTDWYDPEESRLCPQGHRLLRAWGQAALAEGQGKSSKHELVDV